MQGDSATLEPAVPNFREDERLQARYASMLARKIKDFYAEHESSIRRNASIKRDELRDRLNAAQADYEVRKAAADTARDAYRSAYPANVKKTRLIEPSMIDNVRSLGGASKLYRAAEEAWRAAETTAGDIRRLEHNDDQLQIELGKALERAPQVSKEVTESAKWLAEIHAEDDLAEVKTRVDEIARERAAYAERLAAGTVTQQEIRLRAFAAEGIKHVALPISGMLFYRIDCFGPDAYVIVRDTRKQLYALPYDRRLEPVFGDVLDIVTAGKGFEVRRSTRPNGPIPMSLLDHFLTWHDNDDAAAREAYHEHQTFVKAPRTFATNGSADEREATVIELLAEAAAKKA